MRRKSLIVQMLNVWHFLKSPATDWKAKVGVALAVGYLVFPIDLLPDVVPFVGWLDDLGFGALAAWYLMRATQKHFSEKDLNKK
jgi:uncharacterized membrane protein YkvA (DUF1232 family)